MLIALARSVRCVWVEARFLHRAGALKALHLALPPSDRLMRILDPIVLQSPALLPAAIGAIAFQKKAAVYDLMFRTAAETLTTIAAHPKHLGAHRPHRRAPHLGFGADPSSACPYHRSRRRHVAGLVALAESEADLMVPSTRSAMGDDGKFAARCQSLCGDVSNPRAPA
jgi:hypothetical protein